MACNLVTNLEMALIKKPWQCSVLSRTLRVAAPSLPPPPTLEGKGGILAIFQLVCHALVSITFAFSSYSKSAEARNCRSYRNPNRSNRKNRNCIGYQIRKPVNIFRENRKPNAKSGKSANHNEHQNRETEVFWH